jgi:dipeptide/tripeptide permease
MQGHVMVGLSFLFLSAAGYVLGPDISGATIEPAAAAGGAAGDAVEEERVSFMWVLAHIMLITLGELHVQPVGLSFISRFAPEGYASIMMGVWYTGAFGGAFLSIVTLACCSVLLSTHTTHIIIHTAALYAFENTHTHRINVI